MELLLKILLKKFEIKNINIDNIKNAVMDSRKVEKNSLFFAINNGNLYIEDVLNKGAALVIADNYIGEDPRVVKVKDTINCMQDLAKEYREALNVKVIGITGSNGKTTTKDIVYSVLSTKYKCKKTEGNYNNHIGLPYTILQLHEEDEVIVLEMGMSSFGEIDRLSDIAKPDYAIITNIGDSHLEFLKTRENVFKAKSEIVKYVKPDHLIVFGDDFYLRDLNAIKVGYHLSNDYVIENIKNLDTGSEFFIKNKKYEIELNGRHNCINATMGVVLGELFSLSYEEISKGFKNLVLTPMRFQRILKGKTVYINDAYNASPISVNYSLETFDNLYNDRKKIVVLGDMLELGENEIEYHKEVIKKAVSIAVNKVYLYGKRMKEALSSIPENTKIEYFEDKQKIKLELKKEIDLERAILLKGSRGMKMEEIIEE